MDPELPHLFDVVDTFFGIDSNTNIFVRVVVLLLEFLLIVHLGIVELTLAFFPLSLVFWVIPNVITYLMFFNDKITAVKNGNLPEENQLRRTPEKTLITWAIFGGSLGAIIAMKKHRHKTLKPKFRYGIPAIIAIQIIALIAGVIVILQYNPDVFCSRFVELIGSLL